MTARSFASPAVTAEIAAGLVAVGRLLVVSEPPGSDRRPLARGGALAGLGFGPAEVAGRAAAQLRRAPEAGRGAGGLPRPTRRLVKRPAW